MIISVLVILFARIKYLNSCSISGMLERPLIWGYLMLIFQAGGVTCQEQKLPTEHMYCTYFWKRRSGGRLHYLKNIRAFTSEFMCMCVLIFPLFFMRKREKTERSFEQVLAVWWSSCPRLPISHNCRCTQRCPRCLSWPGNSTLTWLGLLSSQVILPCAPLCLGLFPFCLLGS